VGSNKQGGMWHREKKLQPGEDACALELSTGMKQQDDAQVAGCVRGAAQWVLLGHGRAGRGRGQLWQYPRRSGRNVLVPLGPSRDPPSSTMRARALLAFRLVCLAWLWPVGSHFPTSRRHKEQRGDNAQQKHGGWVDVGFNFKNIIKFFYSTRWIPLKSLFRMTRWFCDCGAASAVDFQPQESLCVCMAYLQMPSNIWKIGNGKSKSRWCNMWGWTTCWWFCQIIFITIHLLLFNPGNLCVCVWLISRCYFTTSSNIWLWIWEK